MNSFPHLSLCSKNASQAPRACFLKEFSKRVLTLACALAPAMTGFASSPYTASPEVMQSRRDFAADRFGIFIHWGIYSMFGQGEWYLNRDLLHSEYSKAAAAFYPARFDAGQWADAIRDSGARYVCFTSRHHDGFSMFHTAASDYNIVDATPFGRDVLKELADACHSRDLSLHIYYSHIDLGREDYPKGRTGLNTGTCLTSHDWPGYYSFMNSQLRELLTGYGPVRCIWFDGWLDHDLDSEPFDWQLPEQYALVHSLQPGCMVGNNHHQSPFEGEDFQIFERDLPGENNAGLSGQAISGLPLETCDTMNGMWGYKVADTDYKDSDTLIRYIVRTAGMGANLLLNIGPRPDGRLPEQCLARLKEIGQWMRTYGETIYSTEGGDFPPAAWGVSTRKDNLLYVHILDAGERDISFPVKGDVLSAKEFDSGRDVRFSVSGGNVTLHLDSVACTPDYIVTLTTSAT